MKATFNFNVQIDGYKSVVTMDMKETQGLDVDTLVALGKMFQGVQTKVNQTLEKIYNEKANEDPDKGTEAEAQELEAPPAEVQPEMPEEQEQQQ